MLCILTTTRKKQHIITWRSIESYFFSLRATAFKYRYDLKIRYGIKNYKVIL